MATIRQLFRNFGKTLVNLGIPLTLLLISDDSAMSAAAELQTLPLSTLAYFGLFQHPLRAEEVKRFLHAPGLPPAELDAALEGLVSAGLAYRYGEFYLSQDRPDWIEIRLQNNRRADQILPKAAKMSRLIGGFPFIRAVMISGSLSKHCMAPDGDIDFFIITKKERLWLARLLLVLFKKTFLLNSHRYFCINYFIDTEHLEIEEKNLYTATEIATLLPMYGPEWYDRFTRANDWVWTDWLPNMPKRSIDLVATTRSRFLKSIFEYIFSGILGEWLDRFAMRVTVSYWRRKFHHFDAEVFDSAIKSRRYVSKHHPLYFQQKVLDAHRRAMLESVDKSKVVVEGPVQSI